DPGLLQGDAARMLKNPLQRALHDYRAARLFLQNVEHLLQAGACLIGKPEAPSRTRRHDKAARLLLKNPGSDRVDDLYPCDVAWNDHDRKIELVRAVNHLAWNMLHVAAELEPEPGRALAHQVFNYLFKLIAQLKERIGGGKHQLAAANPSHGIGSIQNGHCLNDPVPSSFTSQ